MRLTTVFVLSPTLRPEADARFQYGFLWFAKIDTYASIRVSINPWSRLSIPAPEAVTLLVVSCTSRSSAGRSGKRQRSRS